ncbi:MAG: PTS-dependent dihydroxyacetone kinase phosphotransferase subunit DhaM [Synergistaceae bacterium]|nr:PTS-dependent dihydroxyacetone kinase phosphotransferase subunit DhaM [Synergistaceae bacterium]MBQ6434511.1 PTS-dependent dihydroxyacetone kinase phosphotransferase subunit DhaM [Synergistaceae bacterium]MBQ6737627.1 PTS-dependent dihydroxyacetone kinase phosphotransferase subunit DhaM [Synergistaceae bacterium]MBQ7068403.1 PTS-dependent dihydroxyacetone kinase phosphotransferase subunit DhaM [Synergistaceae bacterium]MBR0076522.1 PTS-dependent dihydroxyacetone kinase phosphotransferase sub
MVGIVIVSHSWKISEGVCDLAREMAHDFENLISAGGLDDGSIGTDAQRIADAVVEADSGDGVVILADIGSSIMSSETAIELLEDEGREINAVIADAPIVEGAICAVVEAANGGTVDSVLRAAEESKDTSKL